MDSVRYLLATIAPFAAENTSVVSTSVEGSRVLIDVILLQLIRVKIYKSTCCSFSLVNCFYLVS